ncbi:Ger(x)C family spore germination protein [Paenibacillus psychroresistens]|uniref:Ger(X)C family spore germination protein n=1 Tax=Paenibacillus psychroresistens TaxID=1778678 RepID=A0A6B8RMT1_9BACL|nr:Ger(x)C family spore germination protein [Paenibacillus psychroresistens]QGQ97610.1 Ger(x)C family spore germination protein [Paenibacillus psychroresistens]
MIRFIFITSVSLIVIMSSFGCTDFVEPNQLAFVIGSAIDDAGDGEIEVSHQIVIPSKLNSPAKGGGSSESESFVVISAKGKDIFQASQNIQRKMSRRLMLNHRILIAISEEYFKKNDVSKLFDKLNRDPANNLRDISILIKGGSAKEFLMLKHPLEHLSSIAAGKELQLNGMRSFSSRQLAIEYLSEGIRPLIPVLQIGNSKPNNKEMLPIAVFSGFAVLNKKLKVRGFLDNVEGTRAAWMSGKGTLQGVTIPWKDGNGTLSFRFTHLQRRVQSVRGKDPTHIVLSVKAQAYLLENTTSLDMSDVDNMINVQKYLNEQMQKELQLTMDKVQHWGPDVFGIGEHLHRKYPYWWKLQKDDWDEKFKKTDVSIKANILLRSIGTSGERLK